MDEKYIQELTSNVNRVEKRQKSGKIIFIFILILVIITITSVVFFVLPNINLSEMFKFETGPYKTYENPDHNIRIKYPSDWVKGEKEDKSFLLMVVNPEKVEGKDLPISLFGIFIPDSQGDNTTNIDITDFMNGYIALREQNEPGFELSENNPTIIEGYPARKIFYNFYNEKEDIKFENMEIAILKDNRIYVLYFSAHIDVFNEQYGSIIEMIGSFEFTDSKNTSSGNQTQPTYIITANETQIQCNELWNCSQWDECYNFSQNRTCNDINNCLSPIKQPIEQRDCCSWTCTNWSECYFHSEETNVQVRQCTSDDKNCEFEINIKPLTSRFCNFTNPCTDTETNTSYTVRGTVTDKNNIIWKDVCENTTLLIEYSCEEDGDTHTENYICEDPTPFCKLGKCVANLSLG